MAHGIFQVRNKHYLSNEIFPRLSKESVRDIFFKKEQKKKLVDIRARDSEEDSSVIQVK